MYLSWCRGSRVEGRHPWQAASLRRLYAISGGIDAALGRLESGLARIPASGGFRELCRGPAIAPPMGKGWVLGFWLAVQRKP